MPPKQYHYSSPPLNTSPIMADTVTMPNSTFPFAHSINRSTLMAPSRSNDNMTALDKRSAHNALERQRREGLNTKFQQLAHALPELQNVKRPSKSMIVAKSLEFVAKSIQKDSSYKKKILQLRKEHEVLRKHTKMSQQQIRKRLLDDTTSTSNLTIHIPQHQTSTATKKSLIVSSENEKVNSPSMKRHKSNKHPSPPTSPNDPIMPTDLSKKVNHGMNHKFVHHHMSIISDVNNNSNDNNNHNNHIQNNDNKNKSKCVNNSINKNQIVPSIDNEENELAIKNSKLMENMKPTKKNKQTNVNITTTTNSINNTVMTSNKSNTLSMMSLQQSPLPLNVFPVVNESWPPLDISAFQNTPQPSMSHIYEPYLLQQHMISQPHPIPSTLTTNHIDNNSFSSTIPVTQYYTTTNTNTITIPTSFQQTNIQDPSLSFI